MRAPSAEAFIVRKLRQGLAPTLYYHSLAHTLDVAQAAQTLAAAEGVTDGESLTLLRTAALYHDAGFLHTYDGHEARSCDIARATLPEFGYSPGQIEKICALITATQYPQEPHCHLAQILCDADLDYLGRPDFVPISTSLFRELTARQLIASEHAWFQLQERFLTGHRYWTATALTLRAAPKQARLDHIRARLAAWPSPATA
ncbi:HD domain-containing protein [Hymenobacter negativus]|uniref:HD domain-containing protein n=1 Tax=Hymenobacter negativus TaxID=2795026 RepID=A0ABS0QAE5_9BACT|nr:MULTISPECIES: HD domain-containing protein [Bacteria]MBH8559640.1 HD domain-containing protein [Hymenobacter negativus]MBH8570765.1 HD domain-containing protein [Hymenobacter negativus]MBR7210502.1 HD domain-containing protein [Microvirga sp. STS02]